MPRAKFHAVPCLRSVAAAGGPFRSRLFLSTALPSVDGTLAAIAAGGGLATAHGATVAGLTVIAGAGAWSAARREFAGGGHARTLVVLAVASTALAVAAAWGGAAASARWPWFPTVAGAFVLALAANDLRRLVWKR